MKAKDIIIVIGYLAVGAYLSFKFNTAEINLGTFLFITIPLGIFTFNFMVRKRYSFKPYFTAKNNFLTSKYHSVVSSELPKDLMFQKMIEVLNNSKIDIVYTDETNLHILAIKGISWKSWGENIYIDFTEEEGRTQMNFISTTVVGIVSWGKNEKNYHGLLSNFEESLII